MCHIINNGSKVDSPDETGTETKEDKDSEKSNNTNGKIFAVHVGLFLRIAYIGRMCEGL